jgi:hypothetical protein
MTRRRTTKNRVAEVNAALKARGETAKLRRGHGYYYFDGADTAGWYTSSVAVYRASDASVEFWLAQFDYLRANKEGWCA